MPLTWHDKVVSPGFDCRVAKSRSASPGNRDMYRPLELGIWDYGRASATTAYEHDDDPTHLYAGLRYCPLEGKPCFALRGPRSNKGARTTGGANAGRTLETSVTKFEEQGAKQVSRCALKWTPDLGPGIAEVKV
jgi:hypothetical protein